MILLTYFLNPFKMFSPKLLLGLGSLAFLLAGCGATDNPFLTRGETPPDAKIVVVEFSDFNCPACRGAQPVVREVKRQPGVHFELRHLPLPILGHETSYAAAGAYECGAEQDYGAVFEAALFDNQGSFSEEFFANIPSVYGFETDGTFNSTDYQACLAEERHSKLVSSDARTAARANLRSTPSFVVNGKVVTGGSALQQAVAEASN